jgi:pyruvate dehydrogenase E1 component alpha subunit/2-oxoisovalerate dehydrogenase E1 component alpha subunit
VNEVESFPPPARSTIFDDVYAAPTWNLEEQKAQLEALPPAPAHG